jgi:hypothetical protein
MVGLVVGGGGEVPGRQEVVDGPRALSRQCWRMRRTPSRHCACRGGTAVRVPPPPPPRGCGRHLASGCVALGGDARSPASFHSRLSRALAGASSVLRCRGARGVRLGGRRGVSTSRDGDRTWFDRPPRVKLIAVGDAHEVVVPRGLKVQAPEPDFEPFWEGVRTAHGVPLAPIFSANHHRDGWWKLIFSARIPPIWHANCLCRK